MKVHSKQLVSFISVLLMLLLSKTVFWGIENKGIFQWIFYISIFIFFVFYGLNKRKLNDVMLVFIPFSLLFLINIVVYAGEMRSYEINEVIGILLNFLVVAFVATFVNKQAFIKYYLRIMYVISIISIICFLIATINPQMARSLCQPDYHWPDKYGYSFYYTWGWNGDIFARNSGPFWEPGAFQGFLIFALLLLLHTRDFADIFKIKMRMVASVFIVAILTTGSTTGYILLVLIVFSNLKAFLRLYSDLSNRMKFFAAAVIVILPILIVIKSGNISDKLFGDSFASVTSRVTRISDFIGGLELIKKNPVIGLGVTPFRDALKSTYGVNIDDSNGLVSMAYIYGIPMVIYYFYRFYQGLRYLFAEIKGLQFGIVLVVFVILHMTEGIWWLPIYLYIVFCCRDYVVPEREIR